MPTRVASKIKSTSTIYGEKYLVPWLASAGPLSYAPEKPPLSNYYFQYTWILPQIFNPQLNLRQHLYFGALHKHQARFLFRFWERARVEHLTCRYAKLGSFRNTGLKRRSQSTTMHMGTTQIGACSSCSMGAINGRMQNSRSLVDDSGRHRRLQRGNGSGELGLVYGQRRGRRLCRSLQLSWCFWAVSVPLQNGEPVPLCLR
jgi:hypothetical protein